MKYRSALLYAACGVIALCSIGAEAQQTVKICIPSQGNCQDVNAGNPLTVSGTVTTTPGTGNQPVIAGSTTPAGPDISTVTTGGTAVAAFSAGHCARGCILINPAGATQSLCVNGTGTTASGTTTAGALICIPPGQQYGFTARATAISAVSSDSSHAFGGEGYQ